MSRQLLLIVLCFCFTSAQAASKQQAIASAHPLATKAGMEILAAGGNAFDAAVAVSAALAVVEPYSSGLGGGGFWLLHRESDQRQVMVDGREMAPSSATRDMYLDQQGQVVPGRSLDGPLSAGIPGVPAALVFIASHYGRLSLTQNLAPAIRYAEEGFAVTPRYQKLAGFRLPALLASPASARTFLVGNEVPPLGHLILQPELARTLIAITANGYEGFYAGIIARMLVSGVKEAGGNWTPRDLKQYRVKERKPIIGEYHGIRIVSAPPPSSGGIVLTEALNILEAYDLSGMSAIDTKHLVVEAMRRAYRDRAEYLGDPDFVQIPQDRLLSKDHARRIATNIDLEKATPSSDLRPVVAATGKGTDTTHFSVLDAEGNRVAATLSINYPFGSGFTVPGTGILLNNEMDDFSARPVTPNGYGLVGSGANAIEAGKRPLSSMTPTFLEAKDRVAILGTPGGSRIISMVLLATLDFMQGHGPDSWVNVPRYHHQYLPDQVGYELGAFGPEEIEALQAKGHSLKEKYRRYGNMQAILLKHKTGEVSAASDPRGEGAAQVSSAQTEPALAD